MDFRETEKDDSGEDLDAVRVVAVRVGVVGVVVGVVVPESRLEESAVPDAVASHELEQVRYGIRSLATRRPQGAYAQLPQAVRRVPRAVRRHLTLVFVTSFVVAIVVVVDLAEAEVVVVVVGVVVAVEVPVLLL